MPTAAHLSQDQRIVLVQLLQARLDELERDKALQLHGLTQAESARETLLQDADDASQRSGEHEVEGIVSDIDSVEFNAIKSALQRIHGASYGMCIECGAAIPFERLRLEPQTQRCVTCQGLRSL